MIRLIRQFARDWVRAKRGGWLTPSLWETREYLRNIDRYRQR